MGTKLRRQASRLAFVVWGQVHCSTSGSWFSSSLDASDNEGKKVSASAADAYNADISRAEKCAERIVKESEKAEK